MYSMAVSARAGARARARVCGRSEWSALIFFFCDIAMSVIDDRSVSVTSLMPDWVTNLSLIEATITLGP